MNLSKKGLEPCWLSTLESTFAIGRERRDAPQPTSLQSVARPSRHSLWELDQKRRLESNKTRNDTLSGLTLQLADSLSRM